MTSKITHILPPTDKHMVYRLSIFPEEFTKYLRTLFDLLDKEHNGYIKVSDLEDYWGTEYQLDENTSNSIIIKRLYEISPAKAGLLSFPRLCSGIKDALLQVKVCKQRPKSFINALHLNDDEKEDNLQDNETASFTTFPPSYEQSTSSKRRELSEMSLRYVEGEDVENPRKKTGSMIVKGIHMLDKIKWWYSMMHSQYQYNFEVKDLPEGERLKVEKSNTKLEDVLQIQMWKLSNFQADENKQLKMTIKEQQERISQLEGEKSLLIRELFQLKAQLRSPASKKNFQLFN